MLAGVALAAGTGARLRPLSDLRPKVLCPVANVPLLDAALARLEPHADRLAVNAHHLAGQVAAHVGDRALVSVEWPEALGTAGALGRLRDWIDGRDVLVTNADGYLPGGLPAGFVDGWDGERCRLLCAPAGRRRPDFGSLRYVGACLLPWRLVRELRAVPTGLYEVLWRGAQARGELDLFALPADAVAIDCGTPADYLAANLHASGGATVVGAGARVLGTAVRCVVWDGARVAPGEHLVDAVRAGSPEHPVTVRA